MVSSNPTPIQIHIPPMLQIYTIPLNQYLAAHPQYTNLVVSAFIFHSPGHTCHEDGNPPRLLVLQRAAHECAFANLWEVPGGSSDASDPTILHSVAREVYEETGLMLTRFVRQVGDVVEFGTGKGTRQKRWAKLNFEIEVAEIDGCQKRCASEAGPLDLEHLKTVVAGQCEACGRIGDTSAENKEVEIKIDSEEHQNYAWATRDDIKDCKYMVATPEQRELIMWAFPGRETMGEVLNATVKP